MAPANDSGITSNVAGQLADINAQMERITVNNPPGSELNEIAHAIHNLINCIREIHGAR